MSKYYRKLGRLKRARGTGKLQFSTVLKCKSSKRWGRGERDGDGGGGGGEPGLRRCRHSGNSIPLKVVFSLEIRHAFYATPEWEVSS